MKTSIRTVGIVTLTASAVMAFLSDSIPALNGPMYEKHLLEVMFGAGTLVVIPVGFILCAASIAYDHWPTHDAAVRGAFYGASIVVVLVLLFLLVPTVPA